MTTVHGWKQRVAYVPESTKGDSWWWFCHQKVWEENELPMQQSCTQVKPSSQGGYASAEEALGAALVHRFIGHSPHSGKWVKLQDGFWTKVKE